MIQCASIYMEDFHPRYYLLAQVSSLLAFTRHLLAVLSRLLTFVLRLLALKGDLLPERKIYPYFSLRIIGYHYS